MDHGVRDELAHDQANVTGEVDQAVLNEWTLHEVTRLSGRCCRWCELPFLRPPGTRVHLRANTST
jgi:hypothetical protein